MSDYVLNITEVITALGDTVDPIPGQPTQEELYDIKSKLVQALYPTPFDAELGAKHNLAGIVMDPAAYTAHFKKPFPTYTAPPAFETDMDSIDVGKRNKANALNKAKQRDYSTFKAASNAVRTLLLGIFNETWYGELKHSLSGYAEVSPAAIFTHLEKNCRGRHAVDSLALMNRLQGIYEQCDSVADYVKELEDGQRASERIDASTKISDATLLLYATNAMVLTGHFPTANEKWEDLGPAEKTWTKWKDIYLKADQRANIREPLGSANGVFWRPPVSTSSPFTSPPPAGGLPTLDDLTTGFDNLANAATTDKAVLESLVETNKVLTATVAEQSSTIDRLTKEIAQLRRQGGRASGGSEKKLCPNCNKVVVHKPDDCFELEKNAAKRPNGWRSSL
jgi:hypothetical protein